MQLKGSVFLITGGGSGLGAATARMAVDNGAKVVIADVQDGSKYAAELGANARYIKTDVTSEADGKAAVELAIKEFGALNVLVNCAGIAIGEKTIGKTGPHALATFTRVITINLIGTFNMIRLAAETMAKGQPNARRAWRDRQYRFGCGLRRPDRPGRLFGLEGWCGRNDPADRA